MFSKKATKIGKIFTVNLTLCSKCLIDTEDFVNFCGLLRKHKLYQNKKVSKVLLSNLYTVVVGHDHHRNFLNADDED